MAARKPQGRAGSRRGLGPSHGCHLWKQKAQLPLGGVLQGTGQRWPHHLNPGLGEGDDSILRPPASSLGLTVRTEGRSPPGWVGASPLRCP